MISKLETWEIDYYEMKLKGELLFQKVFLFKYKKHYKPIYNIYKP